ncbi:MAG: VWA domain-containing protein [Alphaproteobacteria bacterium]|nr:MAG: VWA domain-containing protein [Alphaproteobacteria bacterium]
MTAKDSAAGNSQQKVSIAAGEKIEITMTAGEALVLAAATAEVQGMTMDKSGALLIQMSDGASLVIKNFAEVATAAGSAFITLPSGQTINLAELIQTLAPSAQDDLLVADATPTKQVLGIEPAAGKAEEPHKVIIIKKPHAHENVVVKLHAGQDYKFAFNMTDPSSVKEQHGQLVIAFKDGGEIIIPNYGAMKNAGLHDIMMKDGTALSVNDLGDTLAQAAQLNEVEPAAGDRGGAHGGGFGFESVFTADPLNSLNKIGPIDPTQLEYGTFDREPDPHAPAPFDDKPIANDDTNTFNGEDRETSGNVITGENGGPGAEDVLSQDLPDRITEVSFGSTTVEVPETGTVTIAGDNGVLTIAADGSYTYTLNENAQGDTTDQFIYTLTDGDGDSDAAVLEIDSDGVPVLFNPNDPEQNPGSRTVDESDLPASSVSGNLTANFFTDTPGTFGADDGSFSAGGSLAGGILSSNGHPVTVTLSADTYTGTANGETVFTLHINEDGSYTFDLLGTLDHADGANPNDIITLNFGVAATDSDGDTDTGTLTIRVLDDAPVANDDTNAFNSEDQTTSGNVITGLNGGAGAADAPSQDDANLVTKVAFGSTTVDVPSSGTVTIAGDHGSLTIAADGSYTYTLNEGPQGDTADQFTYTLTDGDGDTDTAVLEIDADGVPVIFNPNDPEQSPGSRTVDESDLPGSSVSGQLNANFFADTPGSFSASGAGTFSVSGSVAGGSLTSEGHAVTVTLAGNTYTGAANGATVFTLLIDADGSYTFDLVGTLDHADGSNPNDVINLNFGVTATDSDGDTAGATLTIRVLDDAPLANDDHNAFNGEDHTTSGNVITGLNGGAGAADALSHDDANLVTKVAFGSTTVDVPSSGTVTVTGDHGVLTIAADGSYSYTLNDGEQGDTTDQFTYTLADSDGDTDTAVLEVGSDGTPIIFNPNDPEQSPGARTVDESNLPASSVTGQLSANFFTDTPGSFSASGAGTFSAGGSVAGGSLTSEGHPVTVALAGDTYTGTANGATVFTLQINADGSYTFDLVGTLDHADGANPNDVINLNFGVTATDSDGDTASATLTINVLDDAPVANDDHNSFNAEDHTTSGNVITGLNGGAGAADAPSQDDANLVTKVAFGSTTVDVPSSGTVTISSDHGVLTIAADGSYSYTLNESAHGDTADQFTYTLTDGDGDSDTAVLEIGSDGVPIIFNPNDPEQSPGTRTVDESNLNPATSVSGHLSANFFTDTPGSFSASGAGTFSAGGSVAGGSLMSEGHAVTVTLAGNTYTGTANGATVFTLLINADGSYTFDLVGTLDHADGSNPNDVINLNFGVTATDSDGDTASATLTINVLDDAPVANDDHNSFNAEDHTTSGNVITGLNGGAGAADAGSEDTPNHVTQVSFGATTVGVPATGTTTISGDHGVLTIAADGSYSYTLNGGAHGDTADQFTYTLTDGDGDSDTAVLEIGSDGVPIIFNPNDPEQSPGTRTVDESDLPSSSVFGHLSANFFTDTPGSFSASGAGTFSAGGSVAGGSLTSEGHPVTVTLAGDTYIGTANGATVFTLQINSDGSYAFDLVGTLDHADGSNPNDVINLNFGVTATDSDGDTASATLTIRVLDDAPCANDDHNSFDGEDHTTSGNVITGLNGGAGAADALSQDDVSHVTKVAFGATMVDVPTSGTVTISGASGVLTIAADGSYTYTLNAGAQGDTNDQFTYTLTDGDGDTDTAILQIGSDGVPIIFNPNDPEASPGTRTVDETNLSPTTSVTGHLNANFFSDTPGSFSASGAGTFTSGGSLAGGALTSDGHPVTVTLAGNTYTGTANGETIFTLQINNDGSYTFDLKGTLDHADASNPNDVINLNFGVTATDSDGDTASATLTIRVLDDAPVANDDHNAFDASVGHTDGNVISGLNGGSGAGDVLSHDTPDKVTQVSFGSAVVDVPSTGTATINGDHGVLTIAADGSYTYTLFPGSAGGTTTVMEPVILTDGAGLVVEVTGVQTSSGIQFTVKVLSGIADLNGFYLDIGGDGGPITALGSGNNMNPTAGFDYAVNLGTVGGSDPDCTNITFTINNISLADIDNALIGIRATSVGTNREGSVKLTGEVDTTTVHNDTTDIFKYTLTDSDGDHDDALLTFDGITPSFTVGENVSDAGSSTTPYAVGTGHGDINGGIAGDILVGDVGGATMVNQTKNYNIELVLDVSGSMGSLSDHSSKYYMLVQAVNNLLSTFHDYHGGSVTVNITPFDTTAHISGTFNVSTNAGFANALNFLQHMGGGGTTNYESALQAAINWLGGSGPTPGAATYTYFITDGEPNRYVTSSNPAASGTETVSMAQIQGSDGTNEIAQIQALSTEVIGVGINVGTKISNINLIDSDGHAINVHNPADLSQILQAASPLNHIAGVGGDHISGGDGNDIVFGDAMFTDVLAASHGIAMPAGSGWDVFEALEAASGWTRADTINYIKGHLTELSQESTGSGGEIRSGGNDVLDGGAGSDTIFGQEGNDTITGGAGDDKVSGGSGSDIFVFHTGDGVDHITDFDAAHGDKLDFSDVLGSFDPLTDSLHNFVAVVVSGADSLVQVDETGTGLAFHTVVVLEGVHVDLDTLALNGNLIA